MGYLLLAESHTYVCRTWDDSGSPARLGAGEGYMTAKARRANGDVDRPLLPSEQARLVEDATRLTLGCPVRCLGYRTPEFERG